MTSPPLQLQPGLLRAETLHRRVKDPHTHAFRTRVDYLLLPVSGTQTYRLPWLLGWNQPARPFAFKDRDHGEREKASGSAAAWARAQAAAFGLDFAQSAELWLVTQVRIFGFVFNPYASGFVEQGQLRAVIAEVSNTFGEQHAYLCFHDDQRVLEPQDVIEARKLFMSRPFKRWTAATAFLQARCAAHSHPDPAEARSRAGVLCRSGRRSGRANQS